MVMFAMVVRMIVLLLTLFYLVPTISTERAKTIMKIPWAPIPVTSLWQWCHHQSTSVSPTSTQLQCFSVKMVKFQVNIKSST